MEHTSAVDVSLVVTVFNGLLLILNTLLTNQCAQCLRERKGGGYDEPPITDQ